ncbi:MULTISPECIES: helicase associated domain-containing protein [unclassified Streptomyces]|uniref:helicase associated domain-containing protein n=1 Tax=unclassified Streptomyces TaxID=2593676 RepID=UPI000DC2FCC9|nr:MULTISPECIES: helicase associated domain-containing protein [unclassified Streptomyces]RAJ70637.1 helicase-like protein [Streptomyces sp. PsTaAH-137]
MDRDSAVFGPVAFELKLSEAIRRGIVAPYQVVCVEIEDEDLYRALQDAPLGTDRVRGARLAALQTGLLTAAADEKLRRILTFHSRVSEAEAMAAGVPAVAEQLHAGDPGRFPAPERVWAQWLSGEHSPAHRQAVLAEFAADLLPHTQGRAVKAAVRVLASVKVLGDGVDTARCDAVAFMDTRGSMVDIVQMVGRALRIRPGEGKLATLIVPVFVRPGENPSEMLTSWAYSSLTKVLSALRAHDTETIEALADSRVRSGSWSAGGGRGEAIEVAGGDTEGGVADGVAGARGVAGESGVARRDEHSAGGVGQNGHGIAESEGDDGEGQGADGGRGDGRPVVSRLAAALLRFSRPRDPALLARFIQLRVIDPEKVYWRRGIAACLQYLKETGGELLKAPYRYVTPDDWAPAGFPLGVWLADQRKAYNAEILPGERVRQLDALGMVWNAHDHAFGEGLTVARAWADEHGHLLAPVSAVTAGGFPIGAWLKNMRAAARQAVEAAAAHEQSMPVPPGGWGLSESRQDALDAIDPGWCPVWDTGWQRYYRLAKNHLDDGGTLPHSGSGVLVVQGEDLGAWVQAQRLGWDKLGPAQQWLLESVLGIEEASQDERPVRRTQDDKWTLNLTAAQRFHAREGHLQVPRKHTELVPLEEAGRGALEAERDAAGVPVALGMWLANVRRRADKLTAQRRTDLDQLDIRW